MVRTASVMAEAIATGLVARAVVLDGGSADDTATIARDLGVEVLKVGGVLPALGPLLGKGDSLFRGVHAIDADGYVFLDADLGNLSVSHVAVLVDALRRVLDTNSPALVKGGFVRIDEHGVPRTIPGGRITEEVARPLLAQAAPSLARLSQPLSGQVALPAGVARSLRFATGYGLEIAMLLDVVAAHGEEAVIEVDMGMVHNRWKPDDALDEVRIQVLAAAALCGIVDDEHGPFTHPEVVFRVPQ